MDGFFLDQLLSLYMSFHDSVLPPMNRRALLRAGAGIAAASALPTSLRAEAFSRDPLASHPDNVDPSFDVPARRAMAMRAVEAAKSAGAEYADVRLTRMVSRDMGAGEIQEITIGARALVNGYWGFVAGQIPALFAEALEMQQLFSRLKPVNVGRYPIVMDAKSMAVLMGYTLGPATQIDRALGYLANAQGTSFLNDPLAMLGKFAVGSPSLTLTANRSMPHGLATVKWDDDGMIPNDVTLIDKGILTDFQTTRESASWIAPWYERRGVPVRSHGCARAERALDVPMVYPPNLIISPGRETIGFDEMVRDTSRGYALTDVSALGDIELDFQGRTGSVKGKLREIVNGRVGAMVGNGSGSSPPIVLERYVGPPIG